VGVLWALERAIVARAPAMVIGVVITGRPLPPKLLLLAAVRV
jgi:hypothetical protein